MRKAILGAFVVSILGTTPLVAQTGSPCGPLEAKSECLDPIKDACESALADCLKPGCPSERLWASGEYLLWWVKSTPLPVPIVTTGDPAVGFPTLNTAGAIGQTGTQVLLGESSQGFGAFSGIRITVGGWLDTGSTIGVESNIFGLQNRSTSWAAASNGSGNPPLYFPRYNPGAGIQDALPISDPLRGFGGQVFVGSSLEMWGAEANGVFKVWNQSGFEFQALAGFRYLDLHETLQINNTTTDLIYGNVQTLNDYFGTRNQFYGGQIGGQMSYQEGRFALIATGKLALGDTYQIVNVQGNITQYTTNPVTPAVPASASGGFFAQPSNIGRIHSNDFGVLPSGELKAAYQITSRLSGFVGFNVLYLNNVVRPGDQVNHSINLTQNAILDPNGTGTLLGPAQPNPLFNRTDFWALGVNFGLEFRY